LHEPPWQADSSKEDDHVAKKSLIAKAKRDPKYSTRAYHRCNRCGRPRAYYRRFGLCRVCLRELASRGEIPGMRKASW
jgi:small subunit ribosomal protein S14